MRLKRRPHHVADRLAVDDRRAAEGIHRRRPLRHVATSTQLIELPSAIKELEGVRPRGPVIGPLGLGHHEEGGAEGPHDLIEKTPTAEAYIM